jgi:hypothetical protein
LLDWDTVLRTLLLLVISAFVMFVFYKGVLKNPALDPDRIGQNTEEPSQ